MVKEIENLKEYESFIDGFYDDINFSDPHIVAEKEAGKDIYHWQKKSADHYFVVTDNDDILGLFVFIVYEDEKYLEMYTGLSRSAVAIDEMLDYLTANYKGFKADFVFNPRWAMFKVALQKRNASFDIEQQRMVYLHKKFDIDTSDIVPYSDKYRDQYLAMHTKDMYWVGEKVIEAKKRFNIFLAVKDDVVMGYIDVTHCFDENEPYDLFVKPEYRGNGVGKRLLYKALQENEPKDMMLFVDVDNEAAIHLYNSLGFQKQEYGDIQVANVYPL